MTSVMPIKSQPTPAPTPEQAREALTRLGKAKAALILEQPFFATLLVNLPMVRDDTVKTMATDGETFFYNVFFVLEQTMDELKFVLCHEVGHCMFQHMFRRGERDMRRWNQAGDEIINDLLVKESIGKMPAGGLLTPGLVAAGGGTTEGVYDLLPEQKGGGGGGGDHGDPMDECRDAPGDPAQREQAEQEMKVRVAQAAQAAKMMGKLSDGVKRLVDAALRPKVSWADVMRRFWTVRARSETSWAKPKRRWLGEDLYLPSLAGEKLGVMVMFIDCSGSIGQRELDTFAAEVRALHEDCTPQVLHVVYFDADVCHHDVFLPDDTVSLQPHGGGGTRFSPCIEWLYDHDIEPAAAVFLTDLCCNDFGPAPHFPVLWVSTDPGTAPWGEVVIMNDRL